MGEVVSTVVGTAFIQSAGLLISSGLVAGILCGFAPGLILRVLFHEMERWLDSISFWLERRKSRKEAQKDAEKEGGEG